MEELWIYKEISLPNEPVRNVEYVMQRGLSEPVSATAERGASGLVDSIISDVKKYEDDFIIHTKPPHDMIIRKGNLFPCRCVPLNSNEIEELFLHLDSELRKLEQEQ